MIVIPMKIWQMIFPALIALVVVAVLAGLCSEEGGARTITVDDDGEGDYATIQEAVDAAEDGDTIRVNDGEYEENVEIDKTLSLIGNGPDVTTIDGGGEGEVVLIKADWCNVSGFKVTGSGSDWENAGIKVEARYVRISNNTIRDNSYGINLWISDSNTISNNIIQYNGCGIYLDFSDSNTITNNTIQNNDRDGIFLDESDSNTISNNTIRNNSRSGIYFYRYSDSNTISNNAIQDNGWYGIYLYWSDSNTISNNTIQNTDQDGIHLDDYSCSNTIFNNTIRNNSRNGIYLYWDSDSTTVSNNTIQNNNENGIYLDNSDSNTISNNTISENEIGIFLRRGAAHNKAHHNTIFNNTDYGINVSDNDGYMGWSINATHNYWGSDSGPYHSTKNPDGKGGNVTDFVNFRPWLNENGAVNQSSLPSEEDNKENAEGGNKENVDEDKEPWLTADEALYLCTFFGVLLLVFLGFVGRWKDKRERQKP